MNNGTVSPECPAGTEDKFTSSIIEKDFKLLYHQEADRRNTLMKLAQKATRDYDELTYRFQNVNKTNDELRMHLRRRELEFKNLENASQAVYLEYQNLKSRFEVETETMNKAFEKASEWYQENQTLRQETSTLREQNGLLLQKVSESNSSSFEVSQISGNREDTDLREQATNHEKEICQLMSQIKNLKHELAIANNDLNVIRQEELTVKEQLLVVEKENDQCKLENEKLQVEREYAALARQSAIVLTEAASDDRVRKALEDVHDLTSNLLKEREESNKTINHLEGKLASLQNIEKEQEFALMETKIKFLEEENTISRRGMFEARNQNTNLHIEVRDLNLQLKDLVFKQQSLSETVPNMTVPVAPPVPKAIPPPPPPVPPPPPPPPVSAVLNLTSVLGSSRKRSTEVKTKNTAETGGGMNDLIDEIKRRGAQIKQGSLGNDFLRKRQNPKPIRADNSSQPDAVEEMKNLLATMKKSRTGQMRPSAFAFSKTKKPEENENNVKDNSVNGKKKPSDSQDCESVNEISEVNNLEHISRETSPIKYRTENSTTKCETLPVKSGNQTLPVKSRSEIPLMESGSETPSVKSESQTTYMESGNQSLPVKSRSVTPSMESGGDSPPVKFENKTSSVKSGSQTPSMEESESEILSDESESNTGSL